MNAIEIADSLVSERYSDSINFDTALNADIELRRLHAENETLKSMQSDYLNAAEILHGAPQVDVSMLKPLTNKAAKVMDENEALRKDAGRWKKLEQIVCFGDSTTEQEDYVIALINGYHSAENLRAGIDAISEVMDQTKQAINYKKPLDIGGTVL